MSFSKKSASMARNSRNMHRLLTGTHQGVSFNNLEDAMPYCSERTPERRCAASGAGEAAGGEEQHARRRAQFRRAK
jgi:hypothetical protein